MRRILPPALSPRSLTLRVIALSTVWTILAMIAVATLISTLYRQTSQRDFDRLLSAHLFSLIGAVSVADGRLEGTPELGDVRFVEPLSGWYWTVAPASANLAGALASPSLAGRQVPAPSAQAVPFDAQYRRTYEAAGPGGARLSVLETEVVLDSHNRIARFRVMGNLSEFRDELAAFRNRLYAYLALFGLGSVAINAAVILLGLRPLAQARRALGDIRAGRSDRLDGPFPDEIAPLAAEMNALIENNQRMVERARTQVGNLAHSLKTPISVILNEARGLGAAEGRILTEQAESMQLQVQHHLQRARIAAQRGGVVFRTPVVPVIERMVRVISRLNPEKEVSLDVGMAGPVFAGECEDLEEIIGNLLENAGKWSRERVAVTLGRGGTANSLAIEVADDGPGLEPDQIGEALARGRRLDESKPGTGLGLSIVKDAVEAYGGKILFARASLGGLSVRVELPLAD